MKFAGVVALGALAVTACSDEVEVATTELPSISDQLHRNGTEGFFFLPPVVPRPGQRGDFVPAATPTVRIDRIDPVTTTAVETIATYTTTSGPHGERVRAHLKNAPGDDGDDDPEGYFVARWKTNRFHLSTSATYRITVSVPNHVLGYADVDLVRHEKDLKHVDVENFTPLVDGDTLRIKFRIDRPAVDRDLDGALDWQDNCPATPNTDQADGDDDGIGDACTATSTIGVAGGVVTGPSGISMYIPPGALTQATAISIAETAIAPPSSIGALTPVYKLAPEGLVFVRPVHVELPVPAGTTSASVYWTKYNAAVFEPLGGTIAGDTIGVDVTHFSYAVVGSGLGVHAVTLMTRDSYIWGPANNQRAPLNFEAGVTLWVLDGAGDWISLPGSSPTSGLVVFDDVPNGDYVIRRDVGSSAYVISDLGVLDLGSNLPGRHPDTLTPSTGDTRLDVTLADLPWVNSCVGNDVALCHSIEIFSPETNSYLFDGQGHPDFAVVDPDVHVVYSLAESTFGEVSLLENDRLVAARLEKPANEPYRVMTHAGFATVTTPDDQITPVTIQMAPVTPSTSIAIDWRGDLYRDAIETGGNPNTQTCEFCGSLFGVLANAGLATDGFLANADLLLLEDTSGVQISLAGVPFPAASVVGEGNWGEFVSARFIERVDYTLPGTIGTGPGGRFGVGIDWTTSRDRIAADGGVVAPPVTPPRNVLVDGQNSFFDDHAGFDVTNLTLSWDPVPGAQFYSIAVKELAINGANQTIGRPVSLHYTTRHTSFTFWDHTAERPSLEPGKTYVFQIAATRGTSTDPLENALLDSSPGRLFQGAVATTASGIFATAP